MLSVVVTVLNEEGAVDELYRAHRRGARRHAASSSSSSTTARPTGRSRQLERLHAADPRVRAVRLKRNFGQHPAMHAGLVRARGDEIVTMDGDLQNEPEDIPKLVAALDARGRRVAAAASAAATRRAHGCRRG